LLALVKSDPGPTVPRKSNRYIVFTKPGSQPACLGAPRPLENKAVLVNPSGKIEFSYLKSRLVPGLEAKVCSPGNGHLPISDTQYGRVAAAICYEMDFPQLIQQVGRAKADLLLTPASDWKTIKNLHRVGDLFAWLCVASLLIMIAVALRVVR
jgi:apolipoprotein N-acyltransferase